MPPLRALLGAAVVFLVVTVALTYPLVTDLGSFVPSDAGDPYLNTWILWWNAQAVPYTTAWWNAPAFFPSPNALALSEHLLGLSLITTPIIWISGNPQLAYNVAFLLTFILSGLGGFVLGYVLLQRADVSVLIGLAYAFAPYRMAQFSHIHVLSSFWMPFGLAALHLYLRERRWRWLVAFGILTTLQGLTTGHYLLFFPVLVGLWTLWFGIAQGELRAAAAVIAALLLSFVPAVPLLLHYTAVHDAWNLHRGMDEILRFSADVTAFIAGEPNLRWWGGLLRYPGPEAQLFPGLTVVLLIIVALTVRLKADPTLASIEARWRWPRRILIGAAIAVTAIAVAFPIFGSWQLDLGIARVSVQRISRPVSVALVLWLLVLATSPSTRTVIKAQSAFGFYLSATVAMWLLALGPFPTFNGQRVIYWAPYRWLMTLPGFDGIRVPARFTMLASLCLAVAAGIAASRIVGRLSGRWRPVILVALACAIVADGWIHGMPLARPPQPSLITRATAPGGVLELPVGLDTSAMYRGMAHRHPVANGYSGYLTPMVEVIRAGIESYDPDILAGLASLGLRHVVVFSDDATRRDTWNAYVQSASGVTEVATTEGQAQYAIAAGELPRSDAAAVASEAPIAWMTSELFPEDLPQLLDGDVMTPWSTDEPQNGSSRDSLTIGFQDVTHVAGVQIRLGPFRASYPRGLRIDRSLDCQTWETVWEGPTGAMTLRSVMTDPNIAPLNIAFTPTMARCLRLQQTASVPWLYWAFGELRVLAADR